MRVKEIKKNQEGISMLVKLIENIIDREIYVKTTDGHYITLAPGEVIGNINVLNLKELKNVARVVHDLTEVTGG